MIGAGYGTWELRQKGERPIIKDENLDLEGNPVSCLTPKYGKYEWVAEYYQNNTIFRLPGQGAKTNDKCGTWVHPVSCPDFDTKQTTLDGKIKHDRFIVKHSCHKPDCPECYESWTSRQASNTSDKLIQAVGLWKKAGLKNGRIDHIVFSPPQDQAKELIRTPGGSRTLRTMCQDVIKKAGVKGAVIIFHPFRQNLPGESNYNPDIPKYSWYVSPHFHMLVVGYLIKSDNFYQMTGWAYKKMERRETIKGTIKYILSHCGIADGFQAIIYTGIFSNNSIKIDRKWIELEPIKCKACGKEMHKYGHKDCVPDYTDDLGVYLHKVEHRIYKITERALKRFYANNPKPESPIGSQYVRIDDREIISTKNNILSLISQIKACA